MKKKRRVLMILISLLVPIAALLALLAAVPGARAAATWTVGVDSECPTIQDCVSHASIVDGDTIYIPAGLYTETVNTSKRLTFLGAGPLSTTVTAGGSGHVFYVTAPHVTFENMTLTGGMLDIIFNQGAGIFASGSLTLTNVIVRDNLLTGESGKGAGVYAYGDLRIYDSLLEGNQCTGTYCEGGGVRANGDVAVESSNFMSNTAHWHGGGLSSVGTAHVTGGRFQGNKATSSTSIEGTGGGIRAGALVMNGTVLTGNVAGEGGGSFGKGGGVYASSVTLTNTTFSSNSAKHMGGGIFGVGQISGGAFQGNAALLAGAIGWLSPGPWTISGTTFIENSSTAIYVVGDITMNYSLLDRNQNLVLYVASSSAYLTMTGTTVQNTFGRGVQTLGSATISASHFISNAGGIRSSQALDIAASSFISNSDSLGAGVRASRALVRDSLFADNQCLSGCTGGAGIYASTAAAVTDTQFLNNTADGAGAGLYATGTTHVKDSLFQGNSATNVGAGIFLSNGSLTIDHTNFISNVAVFGAGASTNGPLTVTRSLFQENSGGGLSGGTTVITSSHFLSNSAAGGSGGVSASTLRVSDSQFQNNTCSDSSCSGGAISAGGDLVVISSTIRGSRSGAGGAGIHGSGAVTISGSLIEDNRCSGANCVGGGLSSGGNVEIEDSRIISNASGGSGAGIYTSGGLRLVNVTLQNNNCSGSSCFGGGAQANSNQLGITVIDSQFLDNSAYVGGGGLHANGPISASGSLFENNACLGQICYGGGVRGFDLTLSESIFRNNEAQLGGGAAAGDGITVTVSSFEDNSCLDGQCLGGAIHANGSIVMEQSTLSGNQAQGRGGAISAYAISPGTPVTLVNVLLADNTAGDRGEAIYFWLGSSAVILHSTVAASTPMPGTAIYIDGSNVAITNTLITNHMVGIANGSIGDVSEEYNLFFGNTINLSGTVTGGGNSLTADPEFLDPANGDYHLDGISAAVDTALDLGLAVDLDGNPRPIGPAPDRGAYETTRSDTSIYLPLVVKSS